MSPPLLTLALLLLASAVLAAPAMLPREWAPPIPLSQVTVIAPSAEKAEAPAGALRAAAAGVEIVAPEAALQANGLTLKPELLSRTLVLLGGIHTNRALLPFYANYLSFADAAYPGEEGYVIRTVTRPFGPGTAAILLEASDAAGESAAVARFTELLGQVREGSFPWMLEVHLSPEVQQRVQQAPYLGAQWAFTGAASKGPEALAGLIGALDPANGYAYAGDYGIERWIREGALTQDAPGVSAEDVARLDEGLLKTALATANEWWRVRDGSWIGGRHQTMGTSCFTATVELLRRRGNPNDEARALLDQWWSECQAYWKSACSTFHDDLEGIPVYYCPEPTLDWALIMGFDGYLREQLPLVCERAYAVTDNLGHYAGTGTYEECRPGDVYMRVPWGWPLQVAEFFHPGRGYGWLQQTMPNATPWTWAVGRNPAGTRSFQGLAEKAPPPHLPGLTVTPLGEYRYRQLSHDRETAREQHVRYLAAPLERTFEKLCFRDSFAPEGQYLVLEGYQVASADNLPPKDANSIIRYTDLGHIWLHANTEKQGNLPRSAVFCTDGVNDSPQPAGCELLATHDGERVGLAASEFADYTACDWTRNVVWRKGRYFVVVDVLRQIREGEFGLICTFRTPQRAWLQPDGMVLREGLAEMRLRNADGVALALEGGDELEGAAVPTLLRQTQLLDGKPGDARVFRNLLYATDPEHPGDLQVRPVGASALVVRGTIRGETELALIAAAPPGKRLRLGDIQSDARALYLGATDWAQAGGRGLRVGDLALSGAEGTSPPAVRQALERLWAAAKPAARPAATSQEKPSGTRLWRAEGFTALGEAIGAPALTSEPAPAGMVGTLFNHVVERHATVTWPAGAETKLTLDLRQTQPIAQVGFQVGTWPNYNLIPDPDTYPKPRTVQAEFSNDAFQRDVRRQTLTFTSDCTYENQHKGTVWPTLRWTARDVGEKARHLRLTFASGEWPGALGMNELTVRAAMPSATRIVGLLQRDVDGDGKRETILWSDQAELTAVRADGSVALRKQFAGYITAVECYPDLAADGPRVLVTTREARLYCLKPDGTEAWRVDFLESAKQNTDLPIGYSIGLLKKPDGAPLIMVGNYNLASFVSPEGQVVGDCRLPAAYQTMTLSRGYDYDGDGGEEIVSTEVWGCLSVLGANMKPRPGGSLPRGKGLLLDYWRPPTPEQAKAIVCTETGVGLLDLKTMKYDWLHAAQPLNDCAVGDLYGDGKSKIVLAKADGYILIYDGAGQVVRRELVGAAVRSLALVGHSIVAALPGRIVAYAPDFSGRSLVARGEYTHLAPADEPGVVLACGQEGVLEAWRIAR